MFSRRTAFDFEQNRLATALQQRRKDGKKLLDLTQSNPTVAGFDYPEGIFESFGEPSNRVYRPDPAGHLDARECVADIYRSRGCRITAEDILLTSSTSEAYAFLFKLLADPGDAFLVPQPSYPLFQYLADLESVRLVPYPMHSIPEWIVDLDEVRRLIERERPKGFLFVHPNNPTGSFLAADSWSHLRGMAGEHQLPLICDEVFFDYPLTPEPQVDVASQASDVPVFILNGLSKMLLLPQLKLAWIVLRGPESLRDAARRRLEVIGDTFLSVNAVTQNALPRLLRQRRQLAEQARSRLLGNLGLLRSRTSSTGVRLLEPEGGWYAVLRLPAVRTDMEWAILLLERAGVYTHPGVFFGFDRDQYVVVSLLTEEEDFEEGVGRFLELVERSE